MYGTEQRLVTQACGFFRAIGAHTVIQIQGEPPGVNERWKRCHTGFSRKSPATLVHQSLILGVWLHRAAADWGEKFGCIQSIGLRPRDDIYRYSYIKWPL